MPSKTFKPKAPSKRGYFPTSRDRKRLIEKNRIIQLKKLFKNEPTLLNKYLQMKH